MTQGEIVSVALVFGLPILIGFAYTAWIVVRGQQTKSWTPVDGTLRRSAMRSSWMSKLGEAAKAWKPDVEYTFVVRGTEFTGRRLSVSDPSWIFQRYTDEMYRVTETLLCPTPVTVYHHPDRPTKCVLVTGFRPHHLIPLLWTLIPLSGLGAIVYAEIFY